MSDLRIIIKQTILMTRANLKARYRKTFTGFIWVLLNPIITFTVQSIVFKSFLKLQVPNYSIFLLSGLLPWVFITNSLNMGVPSLQFSGELLKSYKINPLVIVSSHLLDNALNFIVSFFIIILPLIAFSDFSQINFIFVFLSLIPLTLGILALTFLLAVFQVFYFDVRFILQFATSILFFMTPIFYPIEYIPVPYHWIALLNPLYIFIAPFRSSFLSIEGQVIGIQLLSSLAVSVVFMGLAYLTWRRSKNEFYLNL